MLEDNRKLRYERVPGYDLSGVSQLRRNFSNKMSFAVLDLDWCRRPRGPNYTQSCVRVNMKSDVFLLKK